MRLVTASLGITILLLVTAGFQTRPPALQSEQPISISTNASARAAFETVARIAGLKVAFGRFSVTDTPVNFQVENMSVSEALDVLSKQTGNLWMPWDNGAILVVADNEMGRSAYNRVFVATIALPSRQDPRPVLEGLKGAAAVGDIIVLKDTLRGIENARQFIASLTDGSSRIEPVFLDATREIYLTVNGSGFRGPSSKRSQLRIPTPGRVSINTSDTLRAIYEQLGTIAGAGVTFGRNFPTRRWSFHVENVDFFDALDLLALQSGTFWQPINERTIQVYDDNQMNRRDFEMHHLEVIYFSEGTTAQRLNEIISTVRTVLGSRSVYLYEPRKAIVLHDTPANLLIVEDLIAALERTPALTKAVVTDLADAFSVTGANFHSVPATRALLTLKPARSLVPFNQQASLRTVYESIAQSAGLGVVFGPRFPQRNVTFPFDNLNAMDALDLLAQQSATFWQPLDEHTILVVDDTQQNRRDYETHLVKTILLPARTTTEELTGLMNILRSSLNLRSVFQSSVAKAIVIHDQPARVAVVEKLIRQLAPNPGSIVSLTVAAPGFAESKFFRNAAVARSQLQLPKSDPISVQVNQDSRLLYETLAGMGGIKVNFHPEFAAGNAMPWRLEGVDVPDALDRISLQTGNYWTVIDSKTILVAPDTAQIRQQFDPQVSRTVTLKTLTQGLAAELVTILRTAFSMRQVESNGAYSLSMKDTPQRIAIAEQVIANLDRP